MKCLVAGEGPTDIGDFARARTYRPDVPDAGVLGAILRKRAPSLRIVDGRAWRSIPKYRARSSELGPDETPTAAETQTVLGLAQLAKDLGYTHVVFVRDRDGLVARERDVEAGLAWVRERRPTISVCGGVATEAIESWLLTLRGVLRAEQLTDPKRELATRWPATTGAEKVAIVEDADFAHAPVHQAASLRGWLERLAAIAPSTPG